MKAARNVMVRSPGFEPGSSTWQADVLNQARLRPQQTILVPFPKMYFEVYYLFPKSLLLLLSGASLVWFCSIILQ